MEKSYDKISLKAAALRILGEVKEFKKDSILTPVFMILEVVCEMIIPFLMSVIIDKGVTAGDLNAIYRTGFLMIITALCGLTAGMLGGKYGASASAGLAKNLRASMFRRIQLYSFENIDKYSTAGLVTRLTTDVTNVQNAYMMLLRMFMRAPSSIIVAMFMAFMISPRLASIYLFAVIVLAVFMGFIMSRATKYFTATFEKYDALNESVQENVSAIRVVKAFVREDYENDKFKKATENIYRMFVKAEGTVVLNMPVMMAAVYTCILLISWLGAHMIVVDELTTGQLMSLLAYCMNILMSLMMVAMVVVMVGMSEASAKRITEVLDEEPVLRQKSDPIGTVADGSITFDHVEFSYAGQSGDPVLKDIDFSVKSGETIGIIGGTGSSKSSLVNLISRLYDVTKGSVSVGGIDVRDYDIHKLRDSVAVVLQKNELFSGTILENLRWGNENATEEQCRRACEIACADEFIERMPDGYYTHIEQGGNNVSGGQKQRLCIARALLKKPKILILDDSTSAVDTATDAKIRKGFSDELPDMTKIIIAQRISSVQSADKIIVMDNGRIDGFDTHENLLKNNVIYRDVFESQNGGSGDFDEKGGE
ncbi:MAG: ABC transporter ATP-binding protein/permease [Lachnospiraceae bacterium]|nr:ABC transporter ATP-binding protein/permease [Lachnospiraceae bacterium]